MADVYWNGSVNNTWDAAGNWEDFATAPYGSIPLHGDDVHFLGARLGANRCGVGPAAVVLLDSISADLAYDNGVNADVCYANCGMVGRPVSTVTIDGDSYIQGGHIDVAYLNHDAAGIGTRANILNSIIDTVYLVGAYSACRSGNVIANVIGSGSNNRVDGTSTYGTVTFNGAFWDTNWNTGSPTITTLNGNGDDGIVTRMIGTTLNLNGDRCSHLSTCGVTGTLNVGGQDCEVSLLGIAIPRVTNGPYMCGLDQVLYDYDSGLVIADLSQIPSYSEGRW